MTLPNAENLVENLKNQINEIIDDKTVLIGVQRGGELILQKIDRDLSEDDMVHAKEIRLHVVENKYLVEIDWKSDVVEIQKKDLPLSIKKQLV